MPRKVSLDDPTRLYQSNLMERLTRAHPAEPFIVWLPMVVGLFIYAVANPTKPWYIDVSVFAGGIFFWTFCEYLLHRFIFHFEPTSEAGKKAMKLIHGIHHQFPNDTDRLVIPPAIGSLVAVSFILIYTGIMGWYTAAPFFAGWVLGYLGYDFVHYSTHHRKPRTFLGRAQRKRHLLHHYKYPDACYGVSTGLWDWVFRTTAEHSVAGGKVKGHPEGVWKVVDNDIGRGLTSGH